MPFYRYRPRRYYWKRRFIWRRPWTRRRYRYRRPGTLIRRRKPLFRRRYRVRRRINFKKKLKYLILKQFQPQKIRKCKIKGNISIFQCGPDRLHHEWTTYMTSYYPEHYQGGGGWSLIKFSLESLFEQRELLRNKWTASNVLMPLCRYTGCKIKFYRNFDVDYICHYSLCYPMKDSVYQHTNAQPNNMMYYTKKIIVPSQKTNPKGKLYIKKKIKPPEQLQNKWYFQADLYKQPLLLLTSSACCLDRQFLNPTAISNNITLNILNTSLISTPNFENKEVGTTFWKPNNQSYFYGTLNGDDDPQLKDLIFIGQTMSYTQGKPIGTTTWTDYSQKNKQHENFGNLFHTNYFNANSNLFVSSKPPTEIFSLTTNRTNKAKASGLALLTQPLHTTCRYTPERDKGDTNKVWLLKTNDTKMNFDPPDDPNLIYEGFPLWCLLWGWTDWQKKLNIISKIDENTLVVIETKSTNPTYTRIVLLDQTFIDGYSPWQHEQQIRYPLDSTSWHPKTKFQDLQIEKICKTGPLTPKTSKFSIEGHINYSFYFKWGGCPNDLENITDPGEQTKWPLPNNLVQGPEIQDPESPVEYELWPFDIRRQQITQRAADRIKKDKTTEKTSFSGTAMSAEPQISTQTKALLQTPTQEEEKETSIEQLQQLRLQRQQLQLQLRQLISQTPSIKF
nr:MAG: ORF1 [TTV-like mini virus]